ncbi:hypothetical protein [Chondromyces crocatus]|uniref:Lipoprotein n=1 Tax=Chondromyces crocatus TaxID=52 RepID=A0A0K1EM88_CHOCO|nr:hypothetical protein [Chondromyces crocatus]AKT41979.1 uncharacterized protein CMC5_062010 [Chondromyces crocatus]
MSARRLLKILLPLTLATTVFMPIACGPELEKTSIDCPPGDAANFRRVSKVIEFHCGTLDCHGNSFRPLRIYGKDGLRKPVALDAEGNLPEDAGFSPSDWPNYHTGGIETTEPELLENARSLCGLEPEMIAEFRERVGKEDEDEAPVLAGELLTIVRKPRLEERHKGGRVWRVNDNPDQCLVQWLIPVEPGTLVNQAACEHF